MAKRLRANATTPERKLWNLLRSYRERGLVFRRQHALGNYIADIYCAVADLVVEIDGKTHLDARSQSRDAGRDAWMAQHGIIVLRFSVSELERDTDAVVATILHTANARRAALGR